MRDSLSYHCSCGERLPQTDLIGEEEAAGGLWVGVESAEDVLSSAPLEVPQTRHHGLQVDGIISHAVASSASLT